MVKDELYTRLGKIVWELRQDILELPESYGAEADAFREPCSVGEAERSCRVLWNAIAALYEELADALRALEKHEASPVPA